MAKNAQNKAPVVGESEEPVIPTPPVEPTPTPTPEPTQKSTKVSSTEERLLGLIDQLTGVIEETRKENSTLRTQIGGLQNMVEAIADKGRLQQWETKQLATGNLKSKYNVMSYHGKIVVGWTQMKQNLVYKNGLGVWQEKLTTELIYEDNSREEVDYTTWQKERVTMLMVCEKEEKDSDGSRYFTLVDDKGKQYRVDSRFVN